MLGKHHYESLHAWGLRELGLELHMKPWQNVLLLQFRTEPDSVMWEEDSQWKAGGRCGWGCWAPRILFMTYNYNIYAVYIICTHICVHDIFLPKDAVILVTFSVKIFWKLWWFFCLILFSFILFLFWWHHSPKTWKSLICIRHAFSK